MLTRYRGALEARDIGALKRIWPALGGRQEEAVSNEFEHARAIAVGLDGVDIRSSGSGGDGDVPPQLLRHHRRRTNTKDDDHDDHDARAARRRLEHRNDSSRGHSMIGRLVLVCLVLAGSAHIADAQTTVQATSPTLAEMLQNVYGPHGLVVDSEAVLPDGSTHSAHFNGAFQSEFGRINVALVRQLGALPIPSPASGFTYSFDSSTGTFVRSTQSFGPILADRAETIGRGRFAFGYGLQQFSFETFDGLRLSHIPAVFTHDDFDLGGGRSDVITTDNTISASVTQTTVSLTYGATEHLDISIGVPLVEHVSQRRLQCDDSSSRHGVESGDPLFQGSRCARHVRQRAHVRLAGDRLRARRRHRAWERDAVQEGARRPCGRRGSSTADRR